MLSGLGGIVVDRVRIAAMQGERTRQPGVSTDQIGHSIFVEIPRGECRGLKMILLRYLSSLVASASSDDSAWPSLRLIQGLRRAAAARVISPERFSSQDPARAGGC